MKQNTSLVDPFVKALPVLFATLVLTLTIVFGTPAAAFAQAWSPSLLAVGGLFSFSGDRPTTLGVSDGVLAPCPTSPNCVSSQSRDGKHRIEPLNLAGTPAETMAQLQVIMADLPRAKIVEATDTYLYVEFTSALMGFVDDVEFYLDPQANVIQVRSASRLGESDLGVNRKRVETIRQKLNGFSLAV